MKRIANRGLALLMAVLMCFSLLTVSGIHNHAHAADINYRYDGTGSFIYNWGTREVDATQLSPNAQAFYTDEYTYDELSKLSGGTGIEDAPNSDLYKKLQQLMRINHSFTTTYNATRDLYQYTDCENSANTSNKISSFYSGTPIGPAWDGGSTWNREHTWPNSKGLGGNDENDIMMLRPTEKSENGSRSNTAYGESSGFYNPNSASNNTHDVRGDVARIMLYVYTRWGNTGKMWGSEGVMESLDVLLKWMEEDPVDTWELGRNDSVQSITGTRNVFVDYPELAFLMFGEDMPNNMTTPSGEAKTHVNCDHNYVAGTPVAPTCTAKGYTPYTCGKCGKTYNDNYTNMADHNYVNGTCTACGAVEGPYYVTEVETGKAYKLGLYSTNKGKEYYFKGTMSTYYGATSTVYEEGVDVYLEETTGGYYLYFTDSSNAKQYINLVANDTHRNFTYATTASSVFSWDADKDSLYTTVSGETCYMGTYGTYVTMSVLRESQLKDTDYFARLYTMGGSTGGGSTDPNPDPNPNPGGSTTATITFDNASKRTVLTTSQQVWVENGITVTNNKTPSSSEVIDKVNPARFYKNSEVIIAYPGMTKIEITCNTSDYATALKNANLSGTVTVSGKVVTIVLSAAADSYTIAALSGGQVRVDSITVYAESGSSGGDEPECQHSWTPANCTEPKTCSLCGDTEGVALGHSWTPATCTEPKTCSVCGDTEGSANGHDYEDGSCTVCGEEDPNWNPGGGVTEAWTLVTDVADLQIGDQIIIAAKSYNKALSTTQNKNNRGAASITKDGDTATFGSDVQIIVLEDGTVSGSFALKVGDGKYLYAASSSKNYLRTGDLNANASWKIQIASSGAATIKAQGSFTRNLLCYNSQNNLFSSYGANSNQLPVVIYKLVVSEPACQHAEWFEATCTDPKTCKSCGETEGEALGHDWADATCLAPKTCQRDDCGLTEGEALGHNYLLVMTTKATCEKDGKKLYKCFNGCGEVIEVKVKATGHKMVDGTCTACGFTEEVVVIDPVTTCGGSEECPLHVFSDLSAGGWYHDGVHYCVSNGLFKGVSDDKFAPGETLTRAQIITILWRLAGSPVVNYAMDFEDVANDQWYTEAIRWAASQEMLDDIAGAEFGVNTVITREQFALVLYRFALCDGQYVTIDGDLDYFFDDAAEVSDYAVRAMEWAFGEGLIQGVSDTELDPSGSVTRAQAATILYRYSENVVE